MLTAAQTTGLLSQVSASFGGGQQTAWFATMTSFSGIQAGGLQSSLSLLNNLEIFRVNLLDGFLWQALIVMLYWGWLVAWWLFRRPHLPEMGNVS